MPGTPMRRTVFPCTCSSTPRYAVSVTCLNSLMVKKCVTRSLSVFAMRPLYSPNAFEVSDDCQPPCES